MPQGRWAPERGKPGTLHPASVAEAWTTFLLRYGEIGIKSPSVRRRFEQRLEANLRRAFKRHGTTVLIDRTWGRFFLETPDPDTARTVIEHTFGLVHASPVTPLSASLDEIEQTVRRLAPNTVRPGDTFAIRARRTGNHEYGSPDVAERCGDAVLDEVPQANVDLDDPDIEIHVEVRNDQAYVFTEFIQAPGGLPRGSQGRVIVPFEGPRSPAAAWLVMRRGASVHALAPASCEPIIETLEPWAPEMRYTLLDGAVSRRGLLHAAEALAKEEGAHALALDEHESRADETQEMTIPLLRPLAGLPGKRWPRDPYGLSKQAAEIHPGPCVDGNGAGPTEALELLKDARTKRL